MFDTTLRPVKDRILDPIARLVARVLPANAVSVAAFLAGAGCAVAVFHGNTPVALALWLTNRIVDGLDGAVARVAGTASDAGAYLDIVLDFLVYAAIPLAMVLAGGDLALATAGAALLGAYYVNAVTWMFLAAVFEKRRTQTRSTVQTSVRIPAGLVEGAETIVAYTLMIGLPSYRLPLMLVFAGLAMLGAAIRFVGGFRTLSAAPVFSSGRDAKALPRPASILR